MDDDYDKQIASTNTHFIFKSRTCEIITLMGVNIKHRNYANGFFVRNY